MPEADLNGPVAAIPSAGPIGSAQRHKRIFLIARAECRHFGNAGLILRACLVVDAYARTDRTEWPAMNSRKIADQGSRRRGMASRSRRPSVLAACCSRDGRVPANRAGCCPSRTIRRRLPTMQVDKVLTPSVADREIRAALGGRRIDLANSFAELAPTAKLPSIPRSTSKADRSQHDDGDGGAQRAKFRARPDHRRAGRSRRASPARRSATFSSSATCATRRAKAPSSSTARRPTNSCSGFPVSVWRSRPALLPRSASARRRASASSLVKAARKTGRISARAGLDGDAFLARDRRYRRAAPRLDVGVDRGTGACRSAPRAKRSRSRRPAGCRA